jgi:hypothetical protein
LHANSLDIENEQAETLLRHPLILGGYGGSQPFSTYFVGRNST